MKTIFKHIMLATTLLMLAGGVVSCNDKEIKDDKSLIFTHHFFSNWVGLDEKLEINANLTHYSYRHEVAEISYRASVRTPKEQWENLTRAFNLEIFTKIPDGSCPLMFDAPTSRFSVFINGEIYSIDNPAHDNKYTKQMQDFFNLIGEQARPFRNTVDSLFLLGTNFD